MSGEISAKEAAEERIWAEQTPPAVLRAPDAPNDVFRENRLSNMRKCRPDVKLTETLQMTLKRDIIVVRTSRFWYDNGML